MRMTGREWLGSIREMELSMNTLEEQIRMERDSMERRTSTISGMPKSQNEGKIEAHMPKCIRLQEELKKRMERNAADKTRALALMEKLQPRYRLLLTKYYMQGKTVEKIAEEMDKSYTWAWYRKRDAEREFDKIFSKNRKSL